MTIRLTFLTIIMLELLSFLGWAWPAFGNVVFLLICFAVLLLTLRDLRLGVACVLAELIVGSHGYEFAFVTGGLAVSLRIGLFLVVMAVAALDMIKKREVRVWNSPYRWPLLALALAVLWAMLRGYMLGNGFGNVFLDANAFFFFAYAFPFWQAIKTRDDLRLLAQAAIGALLASAFEVLVLLYMFTHRLWWALPEVYRWIRDTRVGELTAEGDLFFRIFLQSQIYVVIAIFVVLAGLLYRWQSKTWRQFVADRPNQGLLALLVLLMLSNLVSLSRSNWLGMVVAFAAAIPLFALTVGSVGRNIVKMYALTFVSILAATVIMSAVVFFPFPRVSGAFSASDLFGNRALNFENEAGLGSRWGLIGPLWAAIEKHPLLGSGFGTVVTYKTQDPRILASNPTGEYTTYTFEWGYHALWLKMGLIGFLAYLWFITAIICQGWRQLRQRHQPMEQMVLVGLSLALIALLTIHTTSPYLDHPLGISYLLLLTVVLAVFAEPASKSGESH